MKYHIVTYGCQMNKSDSEKIASKLEKEKYKLTSDIKKADLIIINFCSIRQSAIHRAYDKIHKIKQINPKAKLVLTGCILDKDREKLKNKISEFLPFINLETKPKIKSKNYAYIPIMTGCNNFCSYCIVPYTRGREKSRKAKNIIQEAKRLIKQNYKEIILLGQNVNSYKTDFGKLLESLNKIPGNFKIKFLTNHPKDMSIKLIKIIAKCEKIAKEIHLPVQSGDNNILKRMNRKYTVEKYINLIKKIRQYMPETKISTDIIVGFPTETKKQFQNTIKLIKKIGFSQIYVSVYSPRPGTVAYEFPDDIIPAEKKGRKRIILAMLKK